MTRPPPAPGPPVPWKEEGLGGGGAVHRKKCPQTGEGGPPSPDWPLQLGPLPQLPASAALRARDHAVTGGVSQLNLSSGHRVGVQ